MPAPFLHHQAGDAPGPGLLAILPENLLQLRLGGAVQQRGRGGPRLLRVEPHIQRLIPGEREAALGLLQLEGRQAQVQQDSRYPRQPGRFQQLPQLGVRTVEQLKSGGVVGQPGGGRLENVRVPIQAPELPLRADAVQDGRGMPPLTHGAIHIQAAGPAIQAHQHLPHHHRFMHRIVVCD